MFLAGPRYGDHKCIHDRTHRVCAKLVEDNQSCEEVRWAGRSFWDITGQASWSWAQVPRAVAANNTQAQQGVRVATGGPGGMAQALRGRIRMGCCTGS